MKDSSEQKRLEAIIRAMLRPPVGEMRMGPVNRGQFYTPQYYLEGSRPDDWKNLIPATMGYPVHHISESLARIFATAPGFTDPAAMDLSSPWRHTVYTNLMSPKKPDVEAAEYSQIKRDLELVRNVLRDKHGLPPIHPEDEGKVIRLQRKSRFPGHYAPLVEAKVFSAGPYLLSKILGIKDDSSREMIKPNQKLDISGPQRAYRFQMLKLANLIQELEANRAVVPLLGAGNWQRGDTVPVRYKHHMLDVSLDDLNRAVSRAVGKLAASGKVSAGRHLVPPNIAARGATGNALNMLGIVANKMADHPDAERFYEPNARLYDPNINKFGTGQIPGFLSTRILAELLRSHRQQRMEEKLAAPSRSLLAATGASGQSPRPSTPPARPPRQAPMTPQQAAELRIKQHEASKDITKIAEFIEMHGDIDYWKKLARRNTHVAELVKNVFEDAKRRNVPDLERHVLESIVETAGKDIEKYILDRNASSLEAVARKTAEEAGNPLAFADHSLGSPPHYMMYGTWGQGDTKKTVINRALSGVLSKTEARHYRDIGVLDPHMFDAAEGDPAKLRDLLKEERAAFAEDNPSAPRQYKPSKAMSGWWWLKVNGSKRSYGRQEPLMGLNDMENRIQRLLMSLEGAKIDDPNISRYLSDMNKYWLEEGWKKTHHPSSPKNDRIIRPSLYIEGLLSRSEGGRGWKLGHLVRTTEDLRKFRESMDKWEERIKSDLSFLTRLYKRHVKGFKEPMNLATGKDAIKRLALLRGPMSAEQKKFNRSVMKPRLIDKVLNLIEASAKHHMGKLSIDPETLSNLREELALMHQRSDLSILDIDRWLRKLGGASPDAPAGTAMTGDDPTAIALRVLNQPVSLKPGLKARSVNRPSPGIKPFR